MARKRMRKAKLYKYRILPTSRQKDLIFNHFAVCGYIYNWGLSQKLESYNNGGEVIGYDELVRRLKILRNNNKDMKFINMDILENALKRLEKDFNRYLRRIRKRERKGGDYEIKPPKPKNVYKWRELVFRRNLKGMLPYLSSDNKVYIEVPGIGNIEIYGYNNFPEKVSMHYIVLRRIKKRDDFQLEMKGQFFKRKQAFMKRKNFYKIS